MTIMRQSACLVANAIAVYIYGFLFNCTTVGQASNSVTVPTLSINPLFGAGCLYLVVSTVAGFFALNTCVS